MPGCLIAFEGLDQSGKQTQAEALRDHLAASGHACELLSFPDYTTSIGAEIRSALHGARDYPAEVMQLLYVANRHERKAAIEAWLAAGRVILCDRYVASSVAYGEAQGLNRAWLDEVQRLLPRADLTVLLDITPELAAARKAEGRDRFERDLLLLSRVRASYHAQASDARWVTIAGDRGQPDVSADVRQAVASRLALR